MSRVAKKPITLPAGVDVTVAKAAVTVKGAKGSLQFTLPRGVTLNKGAAGVELGAGDGQRETWSKAGTTRAILQNMVVGVTKGFERKLELVGVGYRAQAQGKVLNLTLGFSHPVKYDVPTGITIETPSQTEVVIKGMDKQLVGQVAADIRAFRAPEPYKGKGVRYSDERVILKEAKKK